MTLKRKFIPGALVFKMKATHGVPVTETLAVTSQKGCSVEWASFVDAALKDGWLGKQILSTIESSLREACFDHGYIDGVIARTKLYLMREFKDAV